MQEQFAEKSGYSKCAKTKDSSRWSELTVLNFKMTIKVSQVILDFEVCSLTSLKRELHPSTPLAICHHQSVTSACYNACC